jgi:hypothetical protein
LPGESLASTMTNVLADIIDQGDRGAGLAQQLFFNLRHSIFYEFINIMRGQ